MMLPGDQLSPSAGAAHRNPVALPTRVEQIRQRMAVLSDAFQASYLRWFKDLRAQTVDDTDVPAIRDAAVAELEALQIRYRSGRITEAGLAYGREQIRGLLGRGITPGSFFPAAETELCPLITDSFPPRLPDKTGRYTPDWVSF